MSVLEALCRKNDVRLADGVDMTGTAETTEGYSGAELESVLLAAGAIAMDDDRKLVEAQDLAQAVADLIPSRDTRMLSYMELLAVFESSARRMLPERYRDMTTTEVQTRLDVLMEQLGSRVR